MHFFLFLFFITSCESKTANNKKAAYPSEIASPKELSYEEVNSIYNKPNIINNDCIKDLWSRIPIRNAPADIMVSNLVKKHLLDYPPNAFIILESGHAHSIAAGIILAENGYNLKFIMNHNNELPPTIQAVGAMKFYANRLNQAKMKNQNNLINAIILDTHDTTDTPKEEFPAIDNIIETFNKNVVWITEDFQDKFGDHIEYYTSIEDPLLKEWLPYMQSSHAWLTQYLKSEKITVVQHFASPYFNNTPKGFIDLIAKDDPLPESCKGWDNW